MQWLMTGYAALAGLWGLSYVIEALRRPPAAPETLKWAPDIPARWATVDGVRMRYIVTGDGPALVLLHTLRTQLDLFRKVIGDLSKDFRVFALDLPGHGYSDVPEADYDPDLFVRSVRGFLQELDIREAVVVGESIGGAVGLVLAAEHDPRVRKVVAINSYDYDRGRGIMRGSLLARLAFPMSNVPILGGMMWRMRWEGAFAAGLRGSVRDARSLLPDLVREMHAVGNRRDHYVAYMSLIAHFPEWEALRRRYPTIDVPVLLVYGEHDWSRPAEREANRALIPGAAMEIVPRAGHLLSLDRPDATVDSVRRFAR